MRRVFAPLVPFGRPSKIAWSNGWTSPLVSLFCGTVTYIKVIERSGGRSPKDLTKRKSQVNKMIGKWKANHYVPIFLVYFLYLFYIVPFFFDMPSSHQSWTTSRGSDMIIFQFPTGKLKPPSPPQCEKTRKSASEIENVSLHRFH